MLRLAGKLPILCVLASAICGQQREPSKEQRYSDDYRHKLDQLTRTAYALAVPYSTDFLSISQLYSTVEEIRKLQKGKSPIGESTSRSDSAIDAYFEWSKKNFQVDGVRPQRCEGKGIGMVATRDLPKHHIFAKVPLNYTISKKQSISMLSACFGSRINHVSAKYESHWQWTLWVALRMAVERLNRASAYSPYIDIIPHIFTHINYYSIDDLKHLQGSNAYEVAIWTYQELVAQYTTIAQILLQRALPGCAKINFTPETFTFDLYRWAVTATITRVFGDSDASDQRMIPFYDSVNHDNHRDVVAQANKWDDKSKKGPQDGGYFVVWITKPVRKGQEIYLEYRGLHAEMDEFFTTWDMIIPEAPMPVDLRVFPFDPEFEHQRTALLTLDVSMETNQINVSPHRSILVKPSDFEILLATSTGNLLSNYDESMWTKAYRYLLDRVELRLRSYPNSIEWCERTLKDKSQGPHSKQALRFVIEEQRSLKQTADRIRNFIALEKDPLTLSELEKLITEEKRDDEERWKDREQPKGLDSIPPYVNP